MRYIRDIDEFLDNIDDAVQTALQRRFLVLRNHVVDSSISGEEYKLVGLKNLSKNQLIMVAILHHWAPLEIQFEIKFELERESRKLLPEDRMLIEMITFAHKNEVRVWLIETNIWSQRAFEGNLLKLGIETLSRVKLINVRTTVKLPQRKRGYNDHGSRAKDPHWKYARDRHADTIEQLRLYQERVTVRDTAYVVKGGLE